MRRTRGRGGGVSPGTAKTKNKGVFVFRGFFSWDRVYRLRAHGKVFSRTLGHADVLSIWSWLSSRSFTSIPRTLIVATGVGGVCKSQVFLPQEMTLQKGMER